MAHWLVKSEPEAYGWDDLDRDGETLWDGVRNNAARLHLRAMQPGDTAFFYHSGDAKTVVGIVEIVAAPEPDPADGDWVAVRVKPVKPLATPVTLRSMKADPRLSNMAMVRQPRLSVSPVTAKEWTAVIDLSSGD